MKRLSTVISFILALFFIVSFFAPRQALAQPTNKFDCEWVSPGVCRVNLSSAACAPGFCTNPLDCAVSFESSCVSKVGQDCIACVSPSPPITPPPGSTCIGETTGLTGICKSTILGCGAGFMKDGSAGCSFGESCCVTEGVECGLLGGECKGIKSGLDICPDGFEPTPIGGFGGLGCSATQVCCKPLVTGCSTWNPITGCSAGTRCSAAPTTCCVNSADCPVFTPGSLTKAPIFCVGNDPAKTTTNPGSGNLATAIGCIPIGEGQEFIAFILSWGIGIGGGIAFLLILYAGFMITTSAGDPKKLQAGRELLTAAIAGLLLLIFSVFILRLIGFTILRLPGFGS